MKRQLHGVCSRVRARATDTLNLWSMRRQKIAWGVRARGSSRNSQVCTIWCLCEACVGISRFVCWCVGVSMCLLSLCLPVSLSFCFCYVAVHVMFVWGVRVWGVCVWGVLVWGVLVWGVCWQQTSVAGCHVFLSVFHRFALSANLSVWVTSLCICGCVSGIWNMFYAISSMEYVIVLYQKSRADAASTENRE